MVSYSLIQLRKALLAWGFTDVDLKGSYFCLPWNLAFRVVVHYMIAWLKIVYLKKASLLDVCKENLWYKAKPVPFLLFCWQISLSIRSLLCKKREAGGNLKKILLFQNEFVLRGVYGLWIVQSDAVFVIQYSVSLGNQREKCGLSIQRGLPFFFF